MQSFKYFLLKKSSFKKKFNFNLKIISQIESARKKNNTNWMDILRIAFENNPEKTAKVMSKIYKDDKKIGSLSKKLL